MWPSRAPPIPAKKLDTVNEVTFTRNTLIPIASAALEEEGTYKFEINHNGFTAYVASKIQPVSGEENTYSLTTYPNLNIYFPDLKLVES